MITNLERWKLGWPYIRGAKAIAEQTQVPFAKECWEYLCGHGVVAYAKLVSGTTCAMCSIEPVQESAPQLLQPRLSIYPLVPEDAQIGENIARICAGSGVAGYFSDSNMIVFRTWLAPEMDFNRGVEFLHEAGHAICAYKEKRIGTIREDLQESAREEVQMYSLSAALWLEYGGDRYRQLLESAVADLKSRLHGKQAFQHLAAPRMWADELQAIFGTVSSKTLQHRLGYLAIFAYMEYYRRFHSANAHDLNVQLMIDTGCAHA